MYDYGNFLNLTKFETILISNELNQLSWSDFKFW